MHLQTTFGANHYIASKHVRHVSRDLDDWREACCKHTTSSVCYHQPNGNYYSQSMFVCMYGLEYLCEIFKRWWSHDENFVRSGVRYTTRISIECEDLKRGKAILKF